MQYLIYEEYLSFNKDILRVHLFHVVHVEIIEDKLWTPKAPTPLMHILTDMGKLGKF